MSTDEQEKASPEVTAMDVEFKEMASGQYAQGEFSLVPLHAVNALADKHGQSRDEAVKRYFYWLDERGQMRALELGFKPIGKFKIGDRVEVKR